MKLLNEILGTKYPIIQGGMANIATGEFAAACSNAEIRVPLADRFQPGMNGK